MSIDYNIPEDKIIITNPQRGSYSVQVIFETEEFNKEKVLDFNTFKRNLSNDEFKELQNLKDIHTNLIMEGCKLNQNMLDSRGNRESGWEEGGKRGNMAYNPPLGWIGFGLKVWDKYDDGNNDWIGCDGNSNEWAVAYHGIGKGGNCPTVEAATKNIYIGGFKAGYGQACSGHQNINKRYKYDPKEDKEDHSETVGIGVYCSPNPNVMDEYAKCSKNINGKEYKMGFMMRVKPDKIRISKVTNDYWVLDGTTKEMRPYRIMIKEA